MRTSATALTILLPFYTALGQFTFVGSTTQPVQVLRTLETAGTKYYLTTPAAITVWNLDLSPYATIVAPPLSAPLEARYITYVTESLFDNDPVTIEYCQSYRDTSQFPVIGGFRILRDDGTILFDQLGGVLPDVLSSQDVFGGPAIFTSAEGTYMAIHLGVNGTDVYELPGHVPCIACTGTVMLAEGHRSSDDPIDLTAFPNPAADQATISYTLPEGAAHATLVLSTLKGSVVSRMAITGSGTKTITTADLATGTYLYHVETDQGMIGAKRLVVVK